MKIIIAEILLCVLLWGCSSSPKIIIPSRVEYATSFISDGKGKIIGMVKDESTKEPLVGVNIVLRATSLGAATDTNGNAEINSVPAGTYTLIISYPGYKTKEIPNIFVTSNERIVFNIELESNRPENITYIATSDGQCRIMGKIKDKSSGELLMGAQAVIPTIRLGAATDATGWFEIKNVPSGSHTLQISLIGFNRKDIGGIDAQPNRLIFLIIELEPQQFTISGWPEYEFIDDGPFIQIGGGYSQLLFSEKSNSGFNSYTYRDFSLSPSIRIGYIEKIYWMREEGFLAPFMGYNRFGGESSNPPPEFHNSLWFDVFECGTLLGFQFSFLKRPLKYIYFEAGIKFNGIIGKPKELNPIYSLDAGIGSLLVRSPWSISLEGWFGLNDLNHGIYSDKAYIRENHFRLMIGYQFELNHYVLQ